MATADPGPLFSVVVPCREYHPRLPIALDSILAQAYVPFEVIVVDDGSAQPLGERLDHTGIRLVRQQPSGVASARNHGARIASGEFLTFLDSDDEAGHDWLSTHAAHLRSPDVCLSSVAADVVGSDGRVVGLRPPRNLGPAFSEYTLQYAPAGTLALPRELFFAVGGYDESLAHSENFELALRLTAEIARRGTMARATDRPLVKYHKGPHAWLSRDKVALRRKSIERVLTKHEALLLRTDRILLADQFAVHGVSCYRLGDVPAARRSLFRSFILAPHQPRRLMRWLSSLVPTIASAQWKAEDEGEV